MLGVCELFKPVSLGVFGIARINRRVPRSGSPFVTSSRLSRTNAASASPIFPLCGKPAFSGSL